MRVIGIDFDNTIVNYDRVFCAVGQKLKLLPSRFTGTKSQVKKTVLKNENGEALWQKMQGLVYGRYMHQARLMDGVVDFISHCRSQQRISLCIISHKTRYGHPPAHLTDLHEVALNWMRNNGLLDRQRLGFSPEEVFFEPDRDAKVDRIARMGCTHFIDDLTEVLEHVNFPAGTHRILYDPASGPGIMRTYDTCENWHQIRELIFPSS